MAINGKYGVTWMMDNTYEVYDREENGKSVYQGSLADCEAWIRLTEDGRL